jgi:ERF superfamily protein
MTTLTHSAEVNELAAALAKAQGEIEGAKKDSANPFFKSSYADLASVRAVIRDPLSRNGIAMVQVPFAEGSHVGVDTMLLHTSGQWIRGALIVTAKDEGPQAIGSCITYLRRYAMQSFAGVAAEDDDGNAAEGKMNGQQAKPVPVKVEPRAPQGFESWWNTLGAVAGEGTSALQDAWKMSKKEYREHLLRVNPQGWEQLKLKALAAGLPAGPVNA